MTRFMLALLVLLPLALWALPDGAESQTVPPQRVKVLARGINLSGWMQRTNAREPSAAQLDILQRAGFTYVRLPLSDALFLADDAAGAFQRLDAAIALLLQHNLAVVLDFHPSMALTSALEKDPATNLPRVSQFWHMAAKRYADTNPDMVFFEVMNEPTLKAKDWYPAQGALIDDIRKLAPRHTLVVTPVEMQSIQALTLMKPYPQPNLVYAIHSYDPLAFTHQGAMWLKQQAYPALKNIPFPAPQAGSPEATRLQATYASPTTVSHAIGTFISTRWDAARLARELARAGRWSAKYHVPVILNEFGAHDKAPAADRARYVRAVRRAAEASLAGWAMWEYQGGFGMAKPDGTLDPALVKALGLNPG